VAALSLTVTERRRRRKRRDYARRTVHELLPVFRRLVAEEQRQARELRIERGLLEQQRAELAAALLEPGQLLELGPGQPVTWLRLVCPCGCEALREDGPAPEPELVRAGIPADAALLERALLERAPILHLVDEVGRVTELGLIVSGPVESDRTVSTVPEGAPDPSTVSEVCAQISDTPIRRAP
jgi:hypothetical protein